MESRLFDTAGRGELPADREKITHSKQTTARHETGTAGPEPPPDRASGAFEGNAAEPCENPPAYATAAPEPFDYPVEVIRSTRRRRYTQARIVNGKLRVRIPAWLSAEQEEETVAELVSSLQRKHQSAHVDLEARARSLADKHGLPLPDSICWSRAQTKWGSCAVAKGHVLISDRLATVPPFVLDYVIVHELAHLVVSDHGPEFQAIVARYPLAERAAGFLLALEVHHQAG